MPVKETDDPMPGGTKRVTVVSCLGLILSVPANAIVEAHAGTTENVKCASYR